MPATLLFFQSKNQTPYRGQQGPKQLGPLPMFDYLLQFDPLLLATAKLALLSQTHQSQTYLKAFALVSLCLECCPQRVT